MEKGEEMGVHTQSCLGKEGGVYSVYLTVK